ncbi:hypothetical protein GYMLUDRAFT_39209 [Collybiopsis luxurians FD-317 M1]|nr:hypothetical protein GYMLUDRAFT_39209 [Collybiopsis luxurians FD-317 M1]
MSLFPPSSVLVIDAAIGDPKYAVVLSQLIRYAKSGGRVICACNFSNHLPYDKAKNFFDSWGLPWDAGSYLRTTVHRNTDKVPPGISQDSFTNLPASYSIKSFQLLNVRREYCFYNPSEDSHLESHVFPSDAFPVDPQETPCAFAPVGSGFFGYVGDVNAEETSTRVVMTMAGLPLSAVTPDARTHGQGLIAHPDGTFSKTGPSNPDSFAMFSDAIRQAGHDIQTGCRAGKEGDRFLGPSKPGGKGPRSSTSATPNSRSVRSREAEVKARAKKRVVVLERKLQEAEKFKDEVPFFLRCSLTI